MDIRITVADVVYPAPGKKQGKIIDQTGKTWQVWGDKMGAYQRGSSYVVQKYKTSDFKGQTYYTIEEAIPAGGTVGNGTPRAAMEQPVKLVASNPFSENERRLDIFVCGAFNNIMANPNVNPAMLEAADMINLVKRLKATWAVALGGPPKAGSDMNDGLPDGM